MSKLICTGSIFAGLIDVLYVMFRVKVPATVWWGPAYMNHPERYVSLMEWVFGNLLLPVIGVGIAVGSGIVLWQISEEICSYLRGEL